MRPVTGLARVSSQRRADEWLIYHEPNSQKAIQTRGSAPWKAVLSFSFRRVHLEDPEVLSASSASWRDAGRDISGMRSREGDCSESTKREMKSRNQGDEKK